MKKAKSHILHALLGLLLGSTLLSSCMPIRSTPKGEEAPEVNTPPSTSTPSLSGEEGKDRFLKSFGELTKGGVKLHVNDGFFAADAKVEGKENRIDFSGADLTFALEGLSLHDLSLSLDAPISYNGVSRYLGLYLANDELYFRVAFPSSPNDQTYSGSSLKYTVDLTPYLGEYDPTVNGEIHYQYGDLTWVIESILSALQGDMKNAPIALNSSKLKIDWAQVLNSFTTIEETRINGLPYFTLNLVLMEGENPYPIGFQASEAFQWTGIDFPSKTTNLPSFPLNPTSRLSLSASVITESAPVTWEKPSDADTYLRLENSLDLFTRIARYIREKAFNLDLDLRILHHEDAIPGTSTSFGRDEVNEGLSLRADASIDMDAFAIEALGANFTLEYLEGKKTDGNIDFVPNGQKSVLGLEYESQAIDPNRRMFMTLNEATSFRTNKRVIDGLLAKLSGINLGGGSSNISSGSISHLLSSLDAIAVQIEEFRKSALGQGIEEGHYEAALDALTHVDIRDNEWHLTIDLSRAGLSGTIQAVLSGKEGSSLASLTFEKAKFAFFEITGTIFVNPYQAISLPNKDTFQELTHLPSFTDQLGILVGSSQASLRFSGYFLQEGTIMTDKYTDAIYGRNEQGTEISGNFAFDLKHSLGSGNMTMVHRKANYFEKHYIDADVSGAEKPGVSSDEDNQLYLRYHSDGASNKNPIMGRMAIGSLNDALNLILSLSGSTDPRFKRISNLMSSSSTTSLIGKIQRGLFLDALSSPLISSLHVTSGETKIILPKASFDLYSDLDIRLLFGDKQYHQDGVTGGIEIKNALNAIEVRTKTGSEGSVTDLYLRIDIDQLDVDENALDATTNHPLLQRNFGLNPDKSAFWDFSSASSLLDHLLDMISLGVTDNNHLTTYHVKGSIDLTIIGISAGKVPIDLFITLDGIQVSVYGRIHVPKVLVAAARNTSTDFFYHTDGKDPTGTLYLRRLQSWKSWGKTYYEYSEHKLSGDYFAANMMDWMLFYAMGLSKTIYDQVHKETTTTEGVNGEDVLTKFACDGANTDNPVWSLGIDIQEIGQLPVSMTLDARIGGVKVNANSRADNALRTLSGEMKILAIIKMLPNLEVVNLIPNGEGYAYVDGWNDPAHNETILDLPDGTESKMNVDTMFSQYFYNEKSGEYSPGITAMGYTTTLPPLTK